MSKIKNSEKRIADIIRILLSNEVKNTLACIKNIDTEIKSVITKFIYFINNGTLRTVLKKDISIDCFQVNNSDEISVNVEIDKQIVLDKIKSIGFSAVEIDRYLLMYELTLWDFPDDWFIQTFLPKMMYDVLFSRNDNEFEKLDICELFTKGSWKVGLH